MRMQQDFFTLSLSIMSSRFSSCSQKR